MTGDGFSHRIYAVRVLVLRDSQQGVGFDRDQQSAAGLAVCVFIFYRFAEPNARVAFEDARRSAGLRIIITIKITDDDQAAINAPDAEFAQSFASPFRVQN